MVKKKYDVAPKKGHKLATGTFVSTPSYHDGGGGESHVNYTENLWDEWSTAPVLKDSEAIGKNIPLPEWTHSYMKTNWLIEHIIIEPLSLFQVGAGDMLGNETSRGSLPTGNLPPARGEKKSVVEQISAVCEEVISGNGNDNQDEEHDGIAC